MTKTKFKVDILALGSENDHILKAIASHNEGKVNVCMPDLISWGVMRSAIYPSVGVSIERHPDDENVLIVTDNGKRTLIIEEVIVYELENANDPDDIKNVL